MNYECEDIPLNVLSPSVFAFISLGITDAPPPAPPIPPVTPGPAQQKTKYESCHFLPGATKKVIRPTPRKLRASQESFDKLSSLDIIDSNFNILTDEMSVLTSSSSQFPSIAPRSWQPSTTKKRNGLKRVSQSIYSYVFTECCHLLNYCSPWWHRV